jgi:hypothetical protein
MFEPVYFVNRHNGSTNYQARSCFCSGAHLLGCQKSLWPLLGLTFTFSFLSTYLIVLLVYIIIQVRLPDNNTAFQVPNRPVLSRVTCLPLFASQSNVGILSWSWEVLYNDVAPTKTSGLQYFNYYLSFHRKKCYLLFVPKHFSYLSLSYYRKNCNLWFVLAQATFCPCLSIKKIVTCDLCQHISVICVTKGCLRSWKVSSIGRRFVRRCYMVLSVGLQKGDMSSNWV